MYSAITPSIDSSPGEVWEWISQVAAKSARSDLVEAVKAFTAATFPGAVTGQFFGVVCDRPQLFKRQGISGPAWVCLSRLWTLACPGM